MVPMEKPNTPRLEFLTSVLDLQVLNFFRLHGCKDVCIENSTTVIGLSQS